MAGQVGVERFDGLVAAFSDRDGVTTPHQSGQRGFGSAALKVNGSIFAMLMGDDLVVKLPRERVAELIGAGTGRTLAASNGTPMREWLTVATDHTWSRLAEEAFEFVGSRSRPR